MDWVNIIVSSICALIGAVSGGGFLYYKYDKQLKSQEIVHNQADEWKRLYEEADSERKELSNKINELYIERSAARNDCAKLTLKNQQLCWYYCTVNGCKNRRPPHKFDINNTEYEATEQEIDNTIKKM